MVEALIEERTCGVSRDWSGVGRRSSVGGSGVDGRDGFGVGADDFGRVGRDVVGGVVGVGGSMGCVVGGVGGINSRTDGQLGGAEGDFGGAQGERRSPLESYWLL